GRLRLGSVLNPALRSDRLLADGDARRLDRLEGLELGSRLDETHKAVPRTKTGIREPPSRRRLERPRLTGDGKAELTAELLVAVVLAVLFRDLELPNKAQVELVLPVEIEDAALVEDAVRVRSAGIERDGGELSEHRPDGAYSR